MLVRKQQLELEMEQQTGSKEGKEYVRAVYCHPAYLTSIYCVCVCVCMCACARARALSHVRFFAPYRL